MKANFKGKGSFDKRFYFTQLSVVIWYDLNTWAECKICLTRFL